MHGVQDLYFHNEISKFLDWILSEQIKKENWSNPKLLHNDADIPTLCIRISKFCSYV